MYKIHIKGNIFYIDDLQTNLRYEAHAKDVLVRVLSINSDDFSFTNVNNWSNYKVIKFSDIDLTGANYTDVASFIEWYEQNTGKSSPSDSGGVPPDLSDYVTNDALQDILKDVWVGDNESLSQNIDGIYDLNDLTVTGSYRPSGLDAGLPFGLHSQVAHYAHPYTNDFGFQIASAYSSNRMFFRNKRNGTWYDWSEIYHTKNAHRTTSLDNPTAADLNSLFPLAENPVGVQVVCTGARKSLYVRTGDTEWRFTELSLVS